MINKLETTITTHDDELAAAMVAVEAARQDLEKTKRYLFVKICHMFS